MAEGLRRLPKEVLEANIQRAKDQIEARKIKIPLDRLTIRGQSGESVFRGQQSKKGK